MTDEDDPAPLSEPQLIPNDRDLGEEATDLPGELEDDGDDEIREPGI
jgi:hypothetical protein